MGEQEISAPPRAIPFSPTPSHHPFFSLFLFLSQSSSLSLTAGRATKGRIRAATVIIPSLPHKGNFDSFKSSSFLRSEGAFEAPSADTKKRVVAQTEPTTWLPLLCVAHSGSLGAMRSSKCNELPVAGSPARRQPGRLVWKRGAQQKSCAL